MSRSHKKNNFYTNKTKSDRICIKIANAMVRNSIDIKSRGYYRKISKRVYPIYRTRFTLDDMTYRSKQWLNRGWHCDDFEEEYMDWLRDFYMK